MANEVIITKYSSQTLIALFKDGKAVEVFLKEENMPEIGDIYIGKVKNIVKNIQAAFVEILPGVMGYYSLIENKTHMFCNSVSANRQTLCAGDEILVQVKKSNIKSKSLVLTNQFQMTSDALVLIANSNFTGISKQIKDSERIDHLKALSAQWSVHSQFGFIFRTKSGKMTDEALETAYNALMVDYNKLMSTMCKRTCFSKLYSTDQNILKYVHAENEKELKVITDLEDVWLKLNSIQSDSAHEIVFYSDDSYPLIKLKNIETLMSRAISKNVWLKSGASIIIEPTETLTAIDVNTSKTEIKKNSQDTFFNINVEAAKEICRQLRLRNLSGMILIDFINMDSKKLNQELFAILKELVKKDPIQLNVIDMTGLGLIELTRKRTYAPLHEQLKRSEAF